MLLMFIFANLETQYMTIYPYFISFTLFTFIWNVSNASSPPDEAVTMQRIDSLTLQLISPKKRTDLIDPRITPIQPTLFHSKMNELGSKFTFLYHTEVERQISYMTNPSSLFMPRCMVNKDVYFPIFEELLDKRKLPDELKYLSVIESALNPNAVSWCGATGLWQFMPGTGKLMKLEINGQIDERKDIIKSTEKALDYLESMYNSYQDWFMALAAYNCGPGNVNKAIKRSGGKRTFWEIKPYLPKETQQYIPKFIAAVFVMNFVDLDQIFTYEKNDLKIIQLELDKFIDLHMVSALMNWDEGVIKEYNAFYKQQSIPDVYKDKKLYLPYKAAMEFLQLKDSIYHIQDHYFFNLSMSSSSQHKQHKVKKGETLHAIAAKYQVTVDDIMSWNKLKNKNIYPNQMLKVVVFSTPNRDVNIYNQSDKYYVITDNALTLGQLCIQYPMIDADKTLVTNDISSVDKPLERGRLLVIVPKSKES
jgi:membrane-bound lytic murein transglycosylase D